MNGAAGPVRHEVRARHWARVLAAALALFMSVAWAGAGETAPTTAPAAATANPVESMPIRRNVPAGGSAKSSDGGKVASGFGFWRVFGAMAIVLGAIFAMRYAGKRFFGLQTTGATSGLIRILARQTVSPRQQIMLVQVGKRLLVVGNCGSQMNVLCEIRDDLEVSELVAQVQKSRPAAGGASFWSAFRREESRYEEPDAAEARVRGAASDATAKDPLPSPPPEYRGREQKEQEVATTQAELAGLLGKVKAISRAFKKA